MRRGVAWVMASVSAALACGGRYQRNPQDFGAPAVAGTASTIAGSPASGGSGIRLGGGGAANSPAEGSAAGGVMVDGGGANAVTCADQAAAFDDYWTEVMTEFQSFPCKEDSDCRSYYFQSPCDPSCKLMTSAAHRGIVDRLNSFGSFNCSADCWPKPWATCPPVAPVRCVSNACQ
ncbi:MAG TPA: hypothetical protein VHB79_06640 [Polyangiaceae bacterium]|nr:hypothetical protein [Polyangiaceae bacterium]